MPRKLSTKAIARNLHNHTHNRTCQHKLPTGRICREPGQLTIHVTDPNTELVKTIAVCADCYPAARAAERERKAAYIVTNRIHLAVGPMRTACGRWLQSGIQTDDVSKLAIAPCKRCKPTIIETREQPKPPALRVINLNEFETRRQPKRRSANPSGTRRARGRTRSGRH
jgi:hypothetical protein